MSDDDDRKFAQEPEHRKLLTRLSELQAEGKIARFAAGLVPVELTNGDRYLIDLQVQWPFRGRGGVLLHGMRRERANVLRGLRHHVLVVVAEPPGPRTGARSWVVLRQWLNDLDAHGEPDVLEPSGNVVWRRDAFSEDPIPTTSTHANLKPIGDA